MKNKAAIILLTLLFVALISALFFTQPAERLLQNLPVFSELYSNGKLTITTRNGVANVKIDGKDYGQTPLELDNLKDGQYQIELERVVKEDNNFYQPYKVFVDLHENTEAIVDIEIAPRNIASGYILYYSPSPDTDDENGFVTLTSKPSKSTVKIDSEVAGTTPIKVLKLTKGEHEIEITQDGFESIKVPVIVRAGFNLNLNVELLPIPINITE